MHTLINLKTNHTSQSHSIKRIDHQSYNSLEGNVLLQFWCRTRISYTLATVEYGPVIFTDNVAAFSWLASEKLFPEAPRRPPCCKITSTVCPGQITPTAGDTCVGDMFLSVLRQIITSLQLYVYQDLRRSFIQSL